MNNTQKNKMKLLNKFLIDNNMSLRGKEIIVDFDVKKSYESKFTWEIFDLDIGLIKGGNPNIVELNQVTPKIKNHWIIDSEGKLKDLMRG